MPSVLSPRLKSWFAIATVMLVASFAGRYATFSRLTNTAHEAASTRELLIELEGLLSTLKDAETGLRGYLITGDASYLEPYEKARNALDEDEARIAVLIGDDDSQRERLAELAGIIDEKRSELKSVVERRQREGLAAAKAIVEADEGHEVMRKANGLAETMIAVEQRRLDDEQRQVRSAERFNLINFFGLAGLNLLLIAVLFNVVRSDATKRMEAAQVIEQHESRLRRVVESNVIGIVFYDAGGTIVDANDAFLQLVGYDRPDLASGRMARASLTSPEFCQRDEQAMVEVTQTGKCTPYEKEYLHEDGSQLPVLVGIARIDDAGSQFVAFVLDLSQRLQAEEARARLAAIVESSDDEIISKTLDGTIVTWNAGATRLFGYTPEEAVGQPNSILVPPDRMDEQRQLLERLRHGERTEHFETVRIAKDGRRIDVALTTSVVRDESGRVIGISTIGRDITARKLAEQERERLLAAEQAARAESERIGRVKDEFLATLSHELRVSPLNSILGWTHLLSSGGMNREEISQGLEIIGRSARAQTQLIEDLLDMSRIISGKLRMDVRPVTLPAVIEAAIESVRPATEAKQVRIQTVLDPNAGPVRGDPNRLQQVVWNLLSNAVKFTPKGGRVQVTLARVDSHVEVTISDAGQGIEPEFLPYVFERFRQADASTTRRHTGLGLGLAIVRNLVESHGGTVSVVSPGKDQGTTFTVALPLMILHENEDGRGRLHPRAEATSAAAAPAPSLYGIKVLIVDDEADARLLVKRLLEDRLATVVTASSTAEAMAAIRDQMPTVLVSDIGMPEEDGYAADPSGAVVAARKPGATCRPRHSLRLHARKIADGRLRAAFKFI